MLPEFKLIVAGGRDFDDEAKMLAEIQRLEAGDLTKYEISIVSGMARGADRLGYDLAKSVGATVHEFKADWDTFGNRAGYLRNVQMGEFADGLLAFWDKKSRGTKHMIDIMNQLVKPVTIINYEREYQMNEKELRRTRKVVADKSGIQITDQVIGLVLLEFLNIKKEKQHGT